MNAKFNIHQNLLIIIFLCAFFTLAASFSGCKPDPVSVSFPEVKPASKVVLINAQGLSLALLNDFYQLGGMTTIRFLQSTGAEAYMHGGVPVSFAGATTSMLTGMNLNRQGVNYWFFEGPGKTLNGFESGHIKTKIIQQMLAMRKIPSLTVFWPVTHPVPKDAGDIVSPGPIPTVKSIEEFQFIPSLEPNLPDRAYPPSLREKVDALLLSPIGDDALLAGLCKDPDENDPQWKAAKSDVLNAFKADLAAMRILDKLWAARHQFIAINLVGADVIGRRFIDLYDPNNLDIDSDRYRHFGRVLYNYYEFLDRFVKNVAEKAGPDSVIILTSDHAIGWAADADPDKKSYPGRPHPMGVFFMAGPNVNVAANKKVLHPYDIAPLVLYQLGQPAGKDFKSYMPDHLMLTRYYTKRPAQIIPSYQDAKSNPEPTVPFGKPIKAADRYRYFGELPPPRAK